MQQRVNLFKTNTFFFFFAYFITMFSLTDLAITFDFFPLISSFVKKDFTELITQFFFGQGDVAFTDLEGPLYPAVSVNRNVTVSLHTSLDAPTRLTSGVPKALHSRPIHSSVESTALESTAVLAQNLHSIHLANATHGHSDYDSQSDTWDACRGTSAENKL